MDPISAVIGIAALLFIIWLCIIVPMNMASNRNRSALGWVLCSLLVSPLVAIIILYAIGPAEPKTARI